MHHSLYVLSPAELWAGTYIRTQEKVWSLGPDRLGFRLWLCIFLAVTIHEISGVAQGSPQVRFSLPSVSVQPES